MNEDTEQIVTWNNIVSLLDSCFKKLDDGMCYIPEKRIVDARVSGYIRGLQDLHQETVTEKEQILSNIAYGDDSNTNELFKVMLSVSLLAGKIDNYMLHQYTTLILITEDKQ